MSGIHTNNSNWERVQQTIETRRLRVMGVILWLAIAGLLFSGDLYGQDRRQVTLRSGLSFEGQVGSFSSFNLAIAAADPYGTDKIVMVDDGLRRVFFCLDYVANTAVSNVRPLNVPIMQKTFSESGGEGYASQLLNIGPFDDKGHRWLAVYDEMGKRQTFVQGITSISPIYVELNTLIRNESGNKNWGMRLATNSIPLPILDQLLHRQIDDPNSPTGFWEIFDLFTEAKLYEKALQELKLIEERFAEQFPDVPADVERARARIKSLAGTQILDEIALRRENGQSELALGIATVYVTEGMSDEKLVEFQDVRREIEQERQNVIDLRKNIAEVVTRFLNTLNDAEQQQRLRQYLNDVETNINVDNAMRFAGILTQLTIADIPDERHVSQMISRWYLGSSQGIDNFAISESLIPVYVLVREYLTTDNVARRDQILTELKSFEGSNPEYLAPLLAQMPPPNPPDLSDYTPEQHLSFTVDMPQVPQANGVALQPRYHVQLPPEYNPYRKYPMVLLLPGMGTPEQILDLWTGSYNSKLQIRQGLAGRHGFIAVSVDWKIPGQVAYGYSAREAATILKTLRSCFRQFSIDTDRVFLAGLGPGAEAAYDVAVAHPDTFAGVCGISGPIAKYTEVYSKNKHLGLPVYSVVGGKDIESRRLSAKTWNEWLTTSKLNDLILVEYHGRLPESFYEELPHVFRWFATNTRRHPNRVDDFELECDIFRPWDNRHYFYELLGLPEESVVWPEFWRTSGYEKMLKMSVLKKGNRFINLRPSKQGAGAIISLNPTIIDFAEKIEISGRGSFKDFVRPSVKTMLEDVRARADRQHPTWAKLIHDNRSWQVAD